MNADLYQGSFGPVTVKPQSVTNQGLDFKQTTKPLSSQETVSATQVVKGSLK